MVPVEVDGEVEALASHSLNGGTGRQGANACERVDCAASLVKDGRAVVIGLGEEDHTQA